MADTAAFDPALLTGDASLNRVEIAHLPAVPSDVVGQWAGDVCSRDALARLVEQARGLPPPRPDRLADQLGSQASSPDPAEREAAVGVLSTFGRRLGALIATLVDPETPGRQGLTPARRAYLEHWQSIRTVGATGGLLAPATGAPILQGARQVLSRCAPEIRVQLGPWAQLAPLVGAARLSGCREARILVIDCGHSSLKPAVARIRNGRLAELSALAPAPAPDREFPDEIAGGIARCLADAATTAAERGPLNGLVVVSVASYLRDGQPVDDTRSAYGRLGRSTALLGDAVGAVVGHPVALRYVHDGTAAAAAAPGRPGDAVITLGTWLGVGFVPPRASLLPLDPKFTITAF